MTKVTITHPELGTASVVASTLDVWLARGWSTSEDTAPPPAASATPPNYADAAGSDVTASRNLEETTEQEESRS